MIVNSVQQQAVIDAVKSSSFNLAVQATAGAGKTKTILDSLNYVSKFKKSIFLSFANSIVKELKDRVPKHIKAATLHSVGYRFILASYQVRLDENKYFKLALDQFKEKNKEVYKKCFTIQSICNYVRMTMTELNFDAINKMCEKYSVDADKSMIETSLNILKENTGRRNINVIDFTDMIFFPAKYPDLINEKYDYVFLDEAQDMSRCQAVFVGNLLKEKGRIIFVGDEKQSIYSFMGSDMDSFAQLEKRFNSKRYALTVTYRCAKSIVELARTVYPDVIEAFEGSPEGEVRQGEINEIEAGDMVICRNTKPLIECFFKLIAQGKKAYVVGKDLEKGLLNISDSSLAYSKSIVEENLDQKLYLLKVDLLDLGIEVPENNPKYIALQEKCEILKFILTRCDTGMDLSKKVNEIFHEDKQAIRLLTIHRSKGMENERVFFIETYKKEKLLPSKYAVLDWQKEQENNLLFVAYTRAKKSFIFLHLD